MKTAQLLSRRQLSAVFQKAYVDGWYASATYCGHHTDAKREFRDFADMYLMGGPL